MSQDSTAESQTAEKAAQGKPVVVAHTPFGTFPIELPEGVVTEEDVLREMPAVIGQLLSRLGAVGAEEEAAEDGAEHAEGCACADRARAREEADRLFPTDPHLNAAVEALVLYSLSEGDDDLRLAALAEAHERISHRISSGPAA